MLPLFFIPMVMTIPKLSKLFSMIREFHLADRFTLANAVCGMGALFSMTTYLQTTDVSHIYFACGLVFIAFVFDVFDDTRRMADAPKGVQS